MTTSLDTINLASILVALFAVVGALLTILHPETLSYKDYLLYMSPMVGGLSVGRGIASHGRK
jgi:hypothetical protein